jgi:hypothetical protein
VTRNRLKCHHKMPIGTDFEQFCAARELIFSALWNAALEYAWIKNAVLEQEKFKMLLWKTGFTENRIKRILFKVLLPDDENDPTGRGIRFSKKAGIWRVFPFKYLAA